MQKEPNTASPQLNTGFGTNYQNYSFAGAERNNTKSFTPRVVTDINSGKLISLSKSRTAAVHIPSYDSIYLDLSD